MAPCIYCWTESNRLVAFSNIQLPVGFSKVCPGQNVPPCVLFQALFIAQEQIAITPSVFFVVVFVIVAFKMCYF